MREREFTVHVHHEDDGHWAEVAELPGCFASGGTLDELREALEEAISLYLHDRTEAGRLTPMEVDEMRVSLPEADPSAEPTPA